MISLICKLLVILAATLPIAACDYITGRSKGTQIPPVVTTGYNHPSADHQKFMKDRYVCIQETSVTASGAAISPICAMVNSCMTTKGYSAVDSGGRLVALATDRVTCR